MKKNHSPYKKAFFDLLIVTLCIGISTCRIDFLGIENCHLDWLLMLLAVPSAICIAHGLFTIARAED